MVERSADNRLSEEQLCEAMEVGTEELLSRVALVFTGHEEWRDRLRAVAYEMLRFLCEDHERARRMTVDVLSAGDRAQLIRDQGMQALIELIDQGRQELSNPDSMTRAIAEGIGGAIYHRMHIAVAADRFDLLESMVPELMYNAVLPYLGTEAAMEELAIPPSDRVNSAVSQEAGRVPSDPSAMATLPADMRPAELPPLGPLPSGRHRYAPEQVAHHQRERLIAGLVALVAERGYAATTIGQIAAAAHVSRRVFYEHFHSKEECFLAAFNVVFEHLRGLMVEAAAQHRGSWPRQLAAALAAALDFFASKPDLAQLCLVESPSAGPALQRRFVEIAETLGPYLRPGRDEPGAPQAFPDSTEVSLVGTVGARLNREIALNGPEGLPGLLPELVEFLLTPYLGQAEAARWAAEAGR